jgi:hypothetical protein
MVAPMDEIASRSVIATADASHPVVDHCFNSRRIASADTLASP